ncbi:uncharacterized protein EI90DRAFT_3092030 [Cantharellus anzutake]|uniref:uncharacterized protein n=1 Tax=Cantharellus anzutake TaxID=1750568 RepID=UPI0019045031|nr:uncharacterized protein EI90DRAFT_3092030 [Cantharellus anzutake]KAF8313348.1 hypothetical protein EI90DRAFT_3092030 [Cantharellus anzutake]
MASSSAAASTSTRIHDDQVDMVIKSSKIHHMVWTAFLSQADSEGNQEWTGFFLSVFSILSAPLRQLRVNIVDDDEQASIVGNFSDVELAECKNLIVSALGRDEWRPLIEYVRRIGDKIVRPRPRVSEGGLQSAFEEPYRGTTDSLFINTLKSYWESSRGPNSSRAPYNWSLSVIQSSGMGKSRMVEQAARSIFTIPINIREDIGPLFRTYPPPDEAFRQYFESHQSKTDDRLQVEYAIILALLFEHATNLLDGPIFNKKKKTGAALALEWTDYLNEGRTDAKVGNNRKSFLDSVAAEAVKLRVSTLDAAQDGAHGDSGTQSPIQRMKVSCSRFVETLPGEAGELKCIIYFDEAHRLAEPVSPRQQNTMRTRSSYHNLGIVLAELTDCAVFFVFLSTSSHLQKLAPSPASHPSARVAPGLCLFPPFTELPFDVFENEVLQSLRRQGKKLSLENMCQPSIMAGFGRSLWYVHHQNWVESRGRPVIPFAGEKLIAQGDETRVFHSQVAALGVRIGITLDMTTKASRVMAAELVESHMRVVYAIPQHREFMHSGTPSEPVLAEAAALYLNDSHGIERRGPEILAQGCGKGLLAQGERGELCGRLLVTVAHDLALTQKYSPKATYNPNAARFHQPVPVLEFLQALFAQPFHEIILNAHSVTARDGVPTLGKAFAKSYICFSHFALAKNTEMLTAQNLAVALRRGMALQAKDNQESIDAVIPVHMGPTSTTILPESTSAINLQFKNRKRAVACHVDRSITVPDISMPVISIVFEFGDEGAATDSLVTIDTKATRRRTRSSVGKMLPDDRHYKITAYGCTSKTFKAVSPDVENHYPSILAARSILEDFPRAKSKENLQALEDLKPYFDGVLESEKRSEEWEKLRSEGRKRPRRSAEPAITPATYYS